MKSTGRKARTPAIGLDFGKAETLSGMRRNDDGTFTLFGANGEQLDVPNGYTSIVYNREKKGPKTTVRIPDSGDAIGSVPRAIARFSEVIGVDTNYQTHQGKLICTTAICKLTNIRYEGPRWLGEFAPLWGLEFHEPKYDAERIGWAHALTTGRAQGYLGSSTNTLLVVDAHLDLLHAINLRTEPVVSDLILPADISIAYASAEATDSALNGLMARCDRIAKELLEHVTRPQQQMPALLREDRTPFTEYRYWKFG